jgi:hypothetical protein
MANKGMRDFVAVFDGTNPVKFDTDGDFFHVQSVSVGGTNVFLSFDEGPLITRQQGEGNRVYYSRVVVSASAACTIVLQLGYGYATDSRATVSATITAPINPALHNPAVPAVNAGPAAQSLILAADPNRLGMVIGLDSTQNNGVFVGDASAANNVGLFVEPGQSLPIFSQDALYVWNNDATHTVKVTVLKLMKT